MRKDSLASVEQTVLFNLSRLECHRARDISDRWIDVKKCSVTACGLPRLKIQRKCWECDSIHLSSEIGSTFFDGKISRRFTNGNNLFACMNLNNSSICEPHEWSLCLSHNQSWFASLWLDYAVVSFCHLLLCLFLACFLSLASLCQKIDKHPGSIFDKSGSGK